MRRSVALARRTVPVLLLLGLSLALAGFETPSCTPLPEEPVLPCDGAACPLEAGDYCAEADPPSGCELGLITLTEVTACTFTLAYAGEDGVDRVGLDGCADDYVNLPTNACGLEYDAEEGAFSVACNWCGRVSYRREYCE